MNSTRNFLLIFFSLACFLVVKTSFAKDEGVIVHGKCVNKECLKYNEQQDFHAGLGTEFWLVDDDKPMSSVCPSCRSNIEPQYCSFKDCMFTIGKDGPLRYEKNGFDFKDQNKYFNIKASALKPPKGLNVLGKCQNSKCSSEGQTMIIPQGHGVFKLVEKEENMEITCPKCKENDFHISEYFFNDCFYFLGKSDLKYAGKEGYFFKDYDKYITLQTSVVPKISILDGLNLLVKCKNEKCEQKNKEKIISRGIGSEWIVKDNKVLSFPCEDCGSDTNLESYFFTNCHCKIGAGQKIDVKKNGLVFRDNQNEYKNLFVTSEKEQAKDEEKIETNRSNEIDGLINLGNSCYINALTSLFAYHPFFDDNDFNGNNFSRKWLKNIELLKKNPTKNVIRNFASFLGYEGRQEDPSAILELMDFPERNVLHFQTTIIRNYDDSIPENLREALDTKLKSTKTFVANYLMLDMTDKMSYSISEKLQNIFGTHIVESGNTELITEKNDKLILSEHQKGVPELVLLKANRFGYEFDRKGNFKKFKISDYLYPDEMINLNFVDSKNTKKEFLKQYELVGIIIHLGSEDNKGHYISRIKHKDRNWYIHDDESVLDEDSYFFIKEIDKEPLINQNGYIFLYRLIND